MDKEFEDGSLDLAHFIMNDIKFSQGENLLKCVQCGMCTSACPGAQHSDYNPRDMIEYILEGDNSIIESEDIWNCFYCYTCHSICPVGNSPCQANQALKQIAIDKGIADDHLRPFLEFGDSFLNQGMGGIPSNFFGEMREDIGDEWWDFKINLDEVRSRLGLGPLLPDEDAIKEISTILINSGFKDRVERIREIKEDEKFE